MRSIEFVTDAVLDPEGWGNTPMGTDVDYFGFTVKMRPSTFLKLAAPLAGDINPELEKHMQAGGKIAYPMLIFREPDEWKKGDFKRIAKVVSHEGRNRMKVWMKLHGDNPIQINMYLSNANRNRYVTNEIVKALSMGAINELGNDAVLDIFDPKTASVNRAAAAINEEPILKEYAVKTFDVNGINIEVDSHLIERSKQRQIPLKSIGRVLYRITKKAAKEITQVEPGQQFWMYDTNMDMSLGLRKLGQENACRLKTVVVGTAYPQGITQIITIEQKVR